MSAYRARDTRPCSGRTPAPARPCIMRDPSQRISPTGKILCVCAEAQRRLGQTGKNPKSEGGSSFPAPILAESGELARVALMHPVMARCAKRHKVPLAPPVFRIALGRPRMVCRAGLDRLAVPQAVEAVRLLAQNPSSQGPPPPACIIHVLCHALTSSALIRAITCGMQRRESKKSRS